MNNAQFLTFMFFLARSYDPMRKLSRLQNSMSQALAAAQHVWEVMDEDVEIPEKPGAIDLPPLRREIEFRNVHFGYGDESRLVLRGVSLTSPPAIGRWWEVGAASRRLRISFALS